MPATIITLSGGNFGGFEVDATSFDASGKIIMTDDDGLQWIYDLNRSNNDKSAEFIGFSGAD